jgi:hypothetical protein
VHWEQREQDRFLSLFKVTFGLLQNFRLEQNNLRAPIHLVDIKPSGPLTRELHRSEDMATSCSRGGAGPAGWSTVDRRCQLQGPKVLLCFLTLTSLGSRTGELSETH